MNALSKMSNLTLRTKFVIAFVTLFVWLAAANSVQIILFIGYVKQYNEMMETITLTNSINGVLLHQLDDEIRDIVYGKTSFESGNQYKLLAQMNTHLDEIELADQKDRFNADITEVRNTLTTANEYVDKLGEQIKFNVPAEEKYITLEYLDIISDLTDEQVQELLQSTLKVSEESKSKIVYSLKRDISIYIGVFSIVILLSFIFAWYISGSIVKPIRRLRENANKIADGNLTVDAVVVNSTNEIGDLCRSYNRMSDNLKKIIQDVRDTNDEVMLSSKDIHHSIQENQMAGEEVANATQAISINLQKQDEIIKQSSSTFEQLFEHYRIMQSKSDQIKSEYTDLYSFETMNQEEFDKLSFQFDHYRLVAEKIEEDVKRMIRFSNDYLNTHKLSSVILREIQLLIDTMDIKTIDKSLEEKWIIFTKKIDELIDEFSHSDQNLQMTLANLQLPLQALQENTQLLKTTNEQTNYRSDQMKQRFQSILSMNDDVYFQINHINKSIHDAILYMESLRHSFENLEKHSNLNKDEVAAIAAMGEEQLATIEEVSEASSKQVDRISRMKDSIRQFTL
ncbi:HAMP domain-containing protein [Aquibacillus kalidii]|uniref:HAMP domain-containing protein n=1 Tax=Aquibacillus kalidii TaxID=2762597 RepID=UPI0016490E49|nr:methyl-accepting chemotaxis protein [Aquibacillus kalidii]